MNLHEAPSPRIHTTRRANAQTATYFFLFEAFSIRKSYDIKDVNDLSDQSWLRGALRSLSVALISDDRDRCFTRPIVSQFPRK